MNIAINYNLTANLTSHIFLNYNHEENNNTPLFGLQGGSIPIFLLTTTGSTATFYQNGVKAEMDQFVAYDASATIAVVDETAYLNNSINAYNMPTH